MVTACLIVLVVIAFYGYKAYVAHAQERIEQLQAMNEEAQRRQIQEAQAKAEGANQRRFELSHWKQVARNGATHHEQVVSYAEMRMTFEIGGNDDGEFLYDMQQRRKASWESDHATLEADGWTKAEWMNHQLQEFDLRRLPDGTWEHRLTRKHWVARVREALVEDKFGFGEGNFKRLTGMTRDEWKAHRDVPEDAIRPWTKIVDDGPAIETGYQRYVHSQT